MSDDEPGEGTKRKPFASRYSPQNTREDGSYKVGKGRPPEHGRFREGDGRPRGRRPKGQRNFDTEFQDEARRRITVREGGKERKVSKLRGTIIRSFDNAVKGEGGAIALIFGQASRISEKQAIAPNDQAAEDDAVIDAWLRDRLLIISESTDEATIEGPEASDEQ